MERIIRPEAVVLPESAIVPDCNVIHPAPNRFTHRITRREPYYYAQQAEHDKPAGQFEPDTLVLLVRSDGARCRVADARGLYVEVGCDALEPV
jgi:hypothetical protein